MWPQAPGTNVCSTPSSLTGLKRLKISVNKYWAALKILYKQILDWFENTLKQILVWFKNTPKQTLGWCWRTRTTVTVETQCETIILGKVVMPCKRQVSRWKRQSALGGQVSVQLLLWNLQLQESRRVNMFIFFRQTRVVRERQVRVKKDKVTLGAGHLHGPWVSSL